MTQISSVDVEPMAVEEVPAGEAAAVDHMIEVLEEQLTQRYIDKKEMVRRDAHPKILGLVRARFVVSDACPPELRHGIFSEPGAAFDADIRFSNGHPELEHDLIPDVRGMAVKLPGVRPYGCPPDQDFVMATAEAFFAIDSVDYVDFPAASVSIVRTIWYFLRKVRRYRAGVRLVQAMKVPASPLAGEYFSQTPYRLGPHCVKFHARPAARRSTADDPWYMLPVVRHVLAAGAFISGGRLVARVPSDAVRRALMRDLATGTVAYDFLVQRWPDLAALPTWAIEDASRTWPAPWVKVATIEIPQQCGIADRDAEAERMTFSPWHAFEVHRPLGSINRARLAVYQTMSAFRNSHNHGGGSGGSHGIVCPGRHDDRGPRAPSSPE